MVGGTLATPTWAPPNVPWDPKQVTWFYQATFTYAHKCSEACNKWYGLLYKYGTYTGPLSAGQREPDGKYVIEPEVSCPVSLTMSLLFIDSAASRLACGLHDMHLGECDEACSQQHY